MKRKIVSSLLSVLLLTQCMGLSFAADWQSGTEVSYTAETTESYIITVPGVMNPGDTGTVVAEGKWKPTSTLIVDADDTVTITCDVDDSSETLDIEFDGIYATGSNVDEMYIEEAIAVENFTAQFGNWSGKFNYNATLVTGGEIQLGNTVRFDTVYSAINVGGTDFVGIFHDDGSAVYWALPTDISGMDASEIADAMNKVEAPAGTFLYDGANITYANGNPVGTLSNNGTILSINETLIGIPVTLQLDDTGMIEDRVYSITSEGTELLTVYFGNSTGTMAAADITSADYKCRFIKDDNYVDMKLGNCTDESWNLVVLAYNNGTRLILVNDFESGMFEITDSTYTGEELTWQNGYHNSIDGGVTCVYCSMTLLDSCDNCVDSDKNFYCDECGCPIDCEIVGYHYLYTSNNGGFYCKYCNTRICDAPIGAPNWHWDDGHEIDEYNHDSYCDICGEFIHTCSDITGDDHCDICDRYCLHTCVDYQNPGPDDGPDGYCDYCGLSMSSTEYVATFADNSWSDIIAACESGEVPDTWNVGDTKAMEIGGNTYNIQIIGKDHDVYSDGSGTAPLTFQLVECYGIKYQMNSTSINTTGWSGSAMRTAHLAEILSAMPSEVQSAIKSVDKQTLKGDKSGLETTSDKLFLLSEYEVFGSTTYSNSNAEGSHYAFYDNDGSTVKTFNGGSAAWWLRGPHYNGSNNFSHVNNNGRLMGNSAGNGSGVAFGFCF